MVQLDHMTGGRAIFGSGPGALPSDAYTLGIDPMTQRDRQDEAIGVIRRLLAGEDRFDYECEWFTMKDAKLQLLPLQEEMPFAVASMISPSGMTLAGKHRTGVLSIGSMSTAGLQALPTQWSFAEDSAAKHGNTVNRKDWRIVMSWHLAETRAKAKEQAKDGLHRWHNEYTVGTLMRPGAAAFETPDSAVEAITKMIDLTGGFGTVIGFVHDWANPKDTFNSWDLVARYVVPEINGYLKGYRESQKYVIEHRDVFDRAGEAVVSKIMENEKAAAAMAEQVTAQSAMHSHNAPDLQEAAKKESAK
jgi:limonene 1,2-monooxygenase